MSSLDRRALQYAANCIDKDDIEQGYKVASALFKQSPEDPQLAFVIAHAHAKAGRYETAYYIYRYCQKFDGIDQAQLFSAIGHCLAEMGHCEEAEKFYLRAAQKAPSHAILASLASIYCKKGDPRKAIEYADRAIELDPKSKEAKWNAALALLKLHQWEKGWEWYDSLIGSKLRPEPPAIDGVALPIWDGNGGNVLIHGEQGLGDELMFSSIVPDAVEQADKIILAVQPQLVGLLQRSLPDVFVVSRVGKEIILPEVVDFTHRYCLGSLGRLFRNKEEDFPGTPFLKPCPMRSTMYRGLLDSLGQGKKIGILWKGGVGGLDEMERSIPLTDLEPLLVQDAHWISLNHLPNVGAECERFYETTGIKIHHFPFTHSKDYDDTSALVSQLDHVVSVTGTVAHCAAGLGIDTHVLVPRMPQWRYGHEGSSIPWYKSMTLYRQTDKWPVEEVADALGLR